MHHQSSRSQSTQRLGGHHPARGHSFSIVSGAKPGTSHTNQFASATPYVQLLSRNPVNELSSENLNLRPNNAFIKVTEVSSKHSRGPNRLKLTKRALSSLNEESSRQSMRSAMSFSRQNHNVINTGTPYANLYQTSKSGA